MQQPIMFVMIIIREYFIKFITAFIITFSIKVMQRDFIVVEDSFGFSLPITNLTLSTIIRFHLILVY